MGHYRPHPSIYPLMWNFQPDDTDESFYMLASATYNEIKEKAQEKWGSGGFSDLSITPERIHTRCIGHDNPEDCDYDTFLLIERIK